MTKAPILAHPVVVQLGQRLRDARMEANMTVREATERLGLDNHTLLVRYENGVVRPPVDRLAQLAAVYGTTLPALFINDAATAAVVTQLLDADPQLLALVATLTTAEPAVLEELTHLLRTVGRQEPR